MISGIFTVSALIGFLGITWWAYTRHNRDRFDEAARLPLTEEMQRTPSLSVAELPPCCRENHP